MERKQKENVMRELRKAYGSLSSDLFYEIETNRELLGPEKTKKLYETLLSAPLLGALPEIKSGFEDKGWAKVSIKNLMYIGAYDSEMLERSIEVLGKILRLNGDRKVVELQAIGATGHLRELASEIEKHQDPASQRPVYFKLADVLEEALEKRGIKGLAQVFTQLGDIKERSMAYYYGLLRKPVTDRAFEIASKTGVNGQEAITQAKKELRESGGLEEPWAKKGAYYLKEVGAAFGLQRS
ncbi:MAG TPA: hypothetical protein VL944_01020 [Candidatus Acidoferrum sp.]|nr:hypothetical protein [Candidatus Acidoferrum sp.]